MTTSHYQPNLDLQLDPIEKKHLNENSTMAARVALDWALDRPLDYSIPHVLLPLVQTGVRVRVPLGKSAFKEGYVIKLFPISQSPFADRLKPIIEVRSQDARIPQKLVELGQWIASYYCCPQEIAIQSMLPSAVRRLKHKTIAWLRPGNSDKIKQFELDNKRKKGQLKALKELLNFPEGIAKKNFQTDFSISSTVLAQLIAAEVIIQELKQVEITSDYFDSPHVLRSQPLSLNEEQLLALKQLQQMMSTQFEKEPSSISTSSHPHAMLLFGVTGSGKTEVYLQAIAYALEKGRQAIVLVPEIALTPQTVNRFKARFGNTQISILHSGLSDRERFLEWNRINSGEVSIAIGARSVLFAPFHQLGLIVVDEEHEASYKQGESPRYHARDVAVVRALREKAVVILGSATPSFESFLNAQKGRYALATLSQRAQTFQLPSVEVVDMRREVYENDRPSLFSKRLIQAISDRLARHEQTILFLNRRGFARQMICDLCGYVSECPHCSFVHTYHQYNHTLLCHFCGEVLPAPTQCPQCGDSSIRFSGAGTEKIETVLNKLFPQAEIRRMDSDTMRVADDYEQSLFDFKKGTVDILIGTQMIAKGLHFPNVTLVGVLNADISLAAQDFRAEERTFQLLTQVAGRAGRGELPGEVIIQTRKPENPAIQYALYQDFEGFFQSDQEIRETFGYPPFTHVMILHFQGLEEEHVRKTAENIYEKLCPFCDDFIFHSPPTPSPMARIKGKFRYQIIFRGAKLSILREKVKLLLNGPRLFQKVDFFVDMDPVSLT